MKLLKFLRRLLLTVVRYLQSRLLWLVGLGPPSFALKIPTHLTDKEKIVLFQTVLRLRRECIALEVGSYLGASASIFGVAVSRRKGELHCIDTWQNQAMDEPERDTWPEFATNTRRLGGVIFPHRGFSVEVAQNLRLTLDFLFLDGDHSEEAVDADLSAWLPKLKAGGVVALHDIGWAEGVRKGYEKHLQGHTVWEKWLPNLLICQL